MLGKAARGLSLNRASGAGRGDATMDIWAADARVIPGRELRHTIEKVSPEAAKPEAEVQE